jgi:DNA-binding Lrp family transcriptional regulator
VDQPDRPRIVADLLDLPEVISAHCTGDADLLAQAVAKNTRDLHRITNAILASAPGRDRTG